MMGVHYLMSDKLGQFPEIPTGIQAFGNFFKNYKSVAAIVTAALPAPITESGAIATYEVHRHFLTVVTPFFAFLLLLLLYFYRNHIARCLFPQCCLLAVSKARRRVAAVVFHIPAVMVLVSVTSIVAYRYYMDRSISTARGLAEFRDLIPSPTAKVIREQVDEDAVPYGGRLQLLYASFFLSAELAVMFMALRDFLAKVLHVNDLGWMKRRSESGHDAALDVE